MTGGEDQLSGFIYELCALLLNILRTPHLATGAAVASASHKRRRRRLPQITPARFASMLLGLSLALILCGSVAFAIGCILMPWVLGIVLLFYFVGFVSTLSGLGRDILDHGGPPVAARTSPKEMSGGRGLSNFFKVETFPEPLLLKQWREKHNNRSW